MQKQAKFYRACGEIGRRARLRIWCFATCRFESYHAHDETKEEFSKKREFLFFLRIDNASSKRSREAPQNVVPRGLRKASVVNFTIRIDNACSIRSQAAWLSHALRVAVSYFGTTTRIPIYKKHRVYHKKRYTLR